jgi:hypothetical protein
MHSGTEDGEEDGCEGEEEQAANLAAYELRMKG